MSGIYFYTKEEEEAKRRYWCSGKSDIKLHIHNPTTVTVSTTSTRKRVEGKKDFLKNSFFFTSNTKFTSMDFLSFLLLFSFVQKGKLDMKMGMRGKLFLNQ